MQRAAPPNLPMTFRPMFGGIMAYADGNRLHRCPTPKR